jgi:competence protein ComEC
MPLLWLSIAFILGILAASFAPLPIPAWLTLAAVSFFLAIIIQLVRQRSQTKSRFVHPLLLLAITAFALGAARYTANLPSLAPGYIAWYNDLQTPLVIEGLIVEPPDVRDGYTNLRVSVRQLHPQTDPLFQPVKGTLLARVSSDGDWQYGDRIRLEGRLETPPSNEEFSYQEYLARQGIPSYLNLPRAALLQHGQGNPFLALIYGLRERAYATIYAIYPDPEAALLAGILLGSDSGIPQGVQDAFKATGTSHIVAISGFNIAIIASIFASVFGKMFGKRWGTLVAILGIIGYTILVGASASVVRAAIMGCLGLFGRLFMRRQVALNSLFFTAMIMCAANPYTPWDIGFQLSFAATLGLVLYATPLHGWLVGKLTPRFTPAIAQGIADIASDVFLLTFAAQMLTMPLIIYHFGRVSLISFVVNPLVLPVQPALMILGGLSVIVGMFWLAVGKLLGGLAWPLVAYTIRVIEAMSGIPGGTFDLGEVALPVVILAYALIFVTTVSGPLAEKIKPALKPSVALSTLALLTTLIWRAAFSAPDGRLHVTLLDVGVGGTGGNTPGDAILIQTPSGRNVLVDGGPSLSQLSQALGRRMPPSARTFDWLVVANPADEQITAVPRLLDRFAVDNVLWAGPTHGSRAARDLQTAVISRGLPQTLAQPGHSLDLGDEARLNVLTIGSRGAILLLTYERFRLLLPLGADFDALEALRMGKDIGPVSAMLLADGGYIASNPPAWINNLRPQAILLSASPEDRNEHPSPETLEAITGYTVLRTDQNGWIELVSDGKQMWVTVEKGAVK